MPLSGLVAFILVGIVLFFAMRHPTLILSSVTTLLAGLIITGAFAAFAVGQLNLISVAFAILFIGLGVDFALHFCLRYKELLTNKVQHIAALHEAGSDVGASLILCSITTSAGFFAFVPTSFKGVSELGLISGAGIIISLITTLTLLPALLSLKKIETPALFESTKEDKPSAGTTSKSIINNPKLSNRIVIVFLVVVSIACFSLPFVSFDNNPINLRSPDSESVSTYLDLLNDAKTSPLSLSTINKEVDEIDALKTRLQALPTVERVVSLSDFVPNNQAEKLDLFTDLEFILGGTTPSSTQPSNETSQAQIDALDSLINRLNEKRQDKDKATIEYAINTLSALRTELQQSSESQKEATLSKLSESLLDDLLSQIQTVRSGLQSNGIEESQLPLDLVKRWKSNDGYYKLAFSNINNVKCGWCANSQFGKRLSCGAIFSTGIYLRLSGYFYFIAFNTA